MKRAQQHAQFRAQFAINVFQAAQILFNRFVGYYTSTSFKSACRMSLYTFRLRWT